MSTLPTMMQAIHFERAGGPEMLTTVQRPTPRPGPREVLVEVAAAGVNGPDLMQRRGLYPAPQGASDLLGLEISGRVIELGSEVTRWRVGDAVTGLTNGGGYAEYCCVDERHVMPVPAGMAIEEAAGLPETYFTVWSNLFHEGRLSSGETLLVHGGAGAIGSTAIRLAKAFGVRVIATESPEERCQFCTRIGADIAIDYAKEDFVEIVRSQGGADMILDIVGGANIEKNFKAARHSARIVQIAFAAGSKVQVDMMPLMLKRLVYTGSTLRTRSIEFKADIARQLLEQVWPLLEQGTIQTPPSHHFRLEEAATAHALMESRGHLGKILLLVRPQA